MSKPSQDAQAPAAPEATAPPEPAFDASPFLRRVDLTVLYPPFAELLPKLVENCAKRGALYVALSGERTWEAQDALYAKGRTTPPLGSGHIVTKAKAGQSPHNYACAVDFARHSGTTFDGKLTPDFSDKANQTLAEEATKLGLESGFYWTFKDSPHVQLPVKKMGFTWASLAEIYRKGGKAAVFAEFDKRLALLKI